MPSSYIYTLSLHDALPIYSLEFLPQLVRRRVPFQKLGLLATSALLFAVGCSREQSPAVEKAGPASAAEQPATDSTVAFAATLDRKSTRLNSSHQIISYAVFLYLYSFPTRRSSDLFARVSASTCAETCAISKARSVGD